MEITKATPTETKNNHGSELYLTSSQRPRYTAAIIGTTIQPESSKKRTKCGCHQAVSLTGFLFSNWLIKILNKTKRPPLSLLSRKYLRYFPISCPQVQSIYIMLAPFIKFVNGGKFFKAKFGRNIKPETLLTKTLIINIFKTVIMLKMNFNKES